MAASHLAYCSGVNRSVTVTGASTAASALPEAPPSFRMPEPVSRSYWAPALVLACALDLVSATLRSNSRRLEVLARSIHASSVSKDGGGRWGTTMLRECVDINQHIYS